MLFRYISSTVVLSIYNHLYSTLGCGLAQWCQETTTLKGGIDILSTEFLDKSFVYRL